MIKNDCGLCKFPALLDNSNDLSEADRFSIVTLGRIGPLSLLILDILERRRPFKTVDLSHRE